MSLAYLRVSDATAEMVFGKDSGINRNTLRHAARRGQLTTTLIGRKQFTTLAWLHEMAAREARPAMADHGRPAPEDAAAAVARAEAAIAALRGA